MNPPTTATPHVLVLQPQHNDGPAFLATWLHQAGIAFELCRIEAGDTVPLDATPYAAIAMLGGSMSVNDDLPFLRRAEQLMRSAIAQDIPVLGHCLGGQLLARALGAQVSDNPVPEIGWTHITRHDHALAREWLGENDQHSAELPVYQWHEQSFALPAGATLLASNAACAHQAFAHGPHLGMQFHIEVDAEKLGRWFGDAPLPGDPRLGLASVQDATAMRADTARLLASSQATAAHIYHRWLGRAKALSQP